MMKKKLNSRKNRVFFRCNSAFVWSDLRTTCVLLVNLLLLLLVNSTESFNPWIFSECDITEWGDVDESTNKPEWFGDTELVVVVVVVVEVVIVVLVVDAIAVTETAAATEDTEIGGGIDETTGGICGGLGPELFKSIKCKRKRWPSRPLREWCR